MTYNYLEVITTKENTVPREGVVAINTDISGNPYLEVYQDGEWVLVDNPEIPPRMSRLDDLFTSLYDRDWFVCGRLFIGEDDKKLYMTTQNYDTSVPRIKKGDPMICFYESEDEESEEEFENMYTKLLRVISMEKTSKEIDLGTDYYRYLVSTRDLIDRSTIIDLYSYSENSTDYGNLLNINDALENEGDYAVKMEILYVKNGVRIPESLMFDASSESFQRSVNQDVTVEFKNGCIRLFPENIEVTECIIYHCYLIYEKLL